MPNFNEPWFWQEQDLLDLIGAVPESLTLEYKRSDDLKNKNFDGISIDVSAFANSAGGLIVYGLIEDGKTRVPKELDGGIEQTAMAPETLENVLTSRIRPRIDGLRVFPIELSTFSPGSFAYIVAVPQSSTAHQAPNKKYYKRFEFKSEPMYDHEIRDVMNRRRYPHLKVLFGSGPPSRSGSVTRFSLLIVACNEGRVRAEEWKIEFWFPKNSVERFAPGFTSRIRSVPPSDRLRRLDFDQSSYRSTETLFPDDRKDIADLDSSVLHLAIETQYISRLRDAHPYWLVWRAFADDAPAIVGEFDIKEMLLRGEY